MRKLSSSGNVCSKPEIASSISSPGIALRACYATPVLSLRTVLSPCTMSGTDLAYGATADCTTLR
eukprot:1612930-Rhodomonas_salina.8